MTMKSLLFALSVASLLPAAAFAAVQTQDVKYAVDGTEYVGFLAYDDANDAKRPGILIAPEWIGLNDYSRGRAKQLAEMGYVAFVFDPYGGGKNAADVKQASEWSGALKADRPELRKRITAGLETLKKQDRVNPDKIAAIGYCFGGTTVLELARSGADIAGVVSFHGGLSTTMPAKAGEVKAKVLVCHGAIDPFVPPEEVAAFEKEMQAANVDWQLISYGNAVHSFTNPAAKGQVKGAEYNEKADKRSWEAMKVFFAELFGDGSKAEAGRTKFGWLDGITIANSPAPADDREYPRKVIYVCDASASVANKFEPLRHELAQAVRGLRPIASYNILFFIDGGKYHINDRRGLLTASLENKDGTYRFLKEVKPAGPSDPIPALEAAFKQNPEVIYFLIAGDFGSLRSYEEVADAIVRLNRDKKTVVHTLLYGTFDSEAEAFLKAIANDHGGRYQYAKEADLREGK